MTQFSDTMVLGISAFIKPTKFFVSICIFLWTMAWYLDYLQMPGKRKSYSVMLVIVFAYEMFVIVWQAANGRLSHFNIDTSFYAILFSMMGVAIVLLTIWTAIITFLFFRKRNFNIPSYYLWGIRLGLLLFLFFSSEGVAMTSRLAHTVGAPDGGPGLPVVNWSKQYGDLRVAHFVGMHALQVIPLFAYFVAKKTLTVVLFTAVYFIFAAGLYLQAMNSIPLFF